MGIIVDRNTRAIVQGITGRQGSFHTKLMLEYGTQIVAGVTPGRGGAVIYGVPVYDTVEEAVRERPANASIVFVPAPFAADAVLESLDAGIRTIVIITEHIPIKDTITIIAHARRMGATIIGPNTPGVITPGECKLGIMPAHVFKPGRVGIVSRSGTLTYEIAMEVTKRGLGESTCIGIGGDPITGLSFVDALKLFENDPQTDAVVLIGEIGGNLEEHAAKYIEEKLSKPVVAFIAGLSAPPERRMGHAGAIVMGRAGTADSKIEALTKAGVKVAKKPGEVATLLERLLKS
ncbi:MAG: succinate--CoA ligase subunit alpha [Candidatus Nezhaarchaeota archaeon]|nr:succinate--CoA ligase subunit alpha [Candidatus Nezhaarchaeota archaeon]MCX8141293.1 succinate--CoA ligase subunit alpha [Candidatus Nezhaarchaeota archaeon]MDW8049559.1 succinate--CoA ligase subunit alpha [Nitrososphaerota archaeon]